MTVLWKTICFLNCQEVKKMNAEHSITNKPYIIILVIVVMSMSLGAQTICYWTGADPTTNAWGSNANWSGNKPGYDSIAVFTNDPATTQNPDMYGESRDGTGLDFQTAGWTIRDSAGTSSLRADKRIRSLGDGVNIVESYVYKAESSTPVIVATNNTLVFAGGAQFGGNLTSYLCDGGTVVFGGDTDRSGYFGTTQFTNDYTIIANVVQGFGAINLEKATIGGTGGLNGWKWGTSNFGEGGKLSPGGTGVFGDEISSFILKSNSDGHTYNFNDGFSVEIQIGETLGKNDKVIFDSPGNQRLDIKSGVTLNLYGSSIEDGDYIIFEKTPTTSRDIRGTFSTVNYNGEAIDSEHFEVAYNGSNIVVSVTGMADPTGTILIIE